MSAEPGPDRAAKGAPWPPPRSHLEATFESGETQEDLALLRQQAQDDARGGLPVPAIPEAEAGKEAVVDAAVANCEAQMDGDRKTTALKSLQVGCQGKPGWGGPAMQVGSCGPQVPVHQAAVRVRGGTARSARETPERWVALKSNLASGTVLLTLAGLPVAVFASSDCFLLHRAACRACWVILRGQADRSASCAGRQTGGQ